LPVPTANSSCAWARRGNPAAIVRRKRRKKRRTKKKKKDKKTKKDKKKDKKKKKKESSGSSSDSDSGAAEKDEEAGSPKVASSKALPEFEAPPVNLSDIPPAEEGICRFHFSVEEKGPLGVRFSGGSPPMILAVNPDSFASKKKIPVNHEVHAINGLAMVPQNQQSVMAFLKNRPLVLDVRPLGWKPAEIVKELKKKQEKEEAERQARMLVENKRREQAAKEAAEDAERFAAEKAAKEEKDKAERVELMKRAREAHKEQREKEEEFKKALGQELPEFRKAAEDIMEAEYGSDIKVAGRRGLPLRLLTRRKEVAWIWAGEVQELIGGGAPDDTFTQ